MHRLLLLLALVMMLGCGGQDENENLVRVAVLPKGTSHHFWKSVHAGAKQAADELGDVEVIWKGPAKESDTAGQIELTKNMITQRVDAICLAPNHSQSLVDVVSEANDAEIPVVVFDSGLADGAEIVSYVATDNRKGGQLAAQRMAKVLNEEGDVIVLRYRAGSESTEQREEGFLEEIAKYPNIKVLSSDQYGGDNAKSAMEKATQLLQRYRDEVDGIFAVCEPNCIGTLEALEEMDLAGKVKFVAFDSDERLIVAMGDGKVDGIVLQDPVKMGYMAVKVAVESIRDKKKFDAYQSTGEYIATPENMGEEEMKALLTPQQFGEN